MTDTNNSNNDRTQHQESHLRIDDLEYHMRWANSLMDKMVTSVRTLPRVNKDGTSECPFVEDLFAEKEERTAPVEKEVPTLHRFVPLVDKEIAAWRKIIAQLQLDKSAINFAKAREEYETAKHGAEHQYKKWVGKKRELLELISKVEEQLKLAKAAQFPGRKPKKSFRPPNIWGASDPQRYQTLPAPQSLADPTASHVNTASQPMITDPLPKSSLLDLVAMGPLGTKVK